MSYGARLKSSLFFCLAAALILAACGDDDDNGTAVDAAVDSGITDSTTADGVAADQTTADQAAADGPSDDAQGADSLSTKAIDVTYQGNTTAVELSQVTPVDFNGAPHARLSDVISIALPDAVQDTLAADFVGGDGFKSGQDSNCTDLIPYSGENFDKGYIDLSDYRLYWETDLNLPGCMKVKNLAEVLLTDI